MIYFAQLPIKTMPDIFNGLPAGTMVSEAIEDDMAVSLCVSINTRDKIILDDDNCLTHDVPANMLTIVSLTDSEGRLHTVSRSVIEMKYDALTLYHGTNEESALKILSGWEPNSGQTGANFGQTRYLYCTTRIENALWFAEENSGSSVLSLNVSLSDIIVDP